MANTARLIGMTNYKPTILKHALKNAVEHDGKAQQGAVINKVIGEHPEAKSDMANLGKQTAEVVNEINAMTQDHQKAELLSLWPNALEKKPEPERQLKPLPGNTSHVVVRFAPNPNGPLTLGGSRVLILNDEYAKKYNGTLHLRFDDTDPQNKKPLPEAYTWIQEEAKWLGCNVSKVYIASDHMEDYYKIAEQLLEKGDMYICTCPAEEFSELKNNGKACPCRPNSIAANKALWKQMHSGEAKKGAAVARIKTDIKLKNNALRDWPAFRIATEPHPRTGTKYRVWPMLDFAGAVLDKMNGITHIIRGKDLMSSTDRQTIMYKMLGWAYPETMYVGRVAIHEFGRLSTSEIKQGIADGRFTGWDDPRLPTLQALIKAGEIKPEALREFWLEFGISERDISADLQILESINRKLT